MFDPVDPRSALAPAARREPARPVVRPSTIEIARAEPHERTPAGSPTWWIRDAAFAVAYTELAAGDSLSMRGSEQEYITVIPSPGALSIDADGRTHRVDQPSVVICPPGESVLTASTPCVVVRAVPMPADTTQRTAGRTPVHAPPRPDGFTAHVYPLSAVPDEPGRFGRIFRCASIMVNLLPVQVGPRDTSALSPHSHDTFSQCSVTLAGSYVHHLRTPWTPRLTEWRDDEHRECTSPSMTLIPAGIEHTTRAVSNGVHEMLDVFAPPREDFCRMPGWVLNEADYPLDTG